MTPETISSIVRKRPSHVSNTLRELVEEGLVVCRTPELRKGRLYELTELGRRVLASIDWSLGGWRTKERFRRLSSQDRNGERC